MTLPRHFILDVDGTITTKDTVSVLASCALASQSQNGEYLTPAWDCIVGDYTKEYRDFVTAYQPAEAERTTMKQEIQFLRQLRDVEEMSFERVSASGLFEGIGLVELYQFGLGAVQKGDVEIRVGFREFVGKVKEAEGKWGIVSVNFSKKFIEGVIGTQYVPILANDPCLAVKGVVRGPKGLGLITTSDGKLKATKEMLKGWDENEDGGVVYVGDSVTDLECLVHDIGIVISEDGESALLRMMKRIGVGVCHISDYQWTDSRGVYWARNFKEIEDIFFPQRRA